MGNPEKVQHHETHTRAMDLIEWMSHGNEDLIHYSYTTLGSTVRVTRIVAREPFANEGLGNKGGVRLITKGSLEKIDLYIASSLPKFNLTGLTPEELGHEQTIKIVLQRYSEVLNAMPVINEVRARLLPLEGLSPAKPLV